MATLDGLATSLPAPLSQSAQIILDPRSSAIFIILVGSYRKFTNTVARREPSLIMPAIDLAIACTPPAMLHGVTALQGLWNEHQLMQLAERPAEAISVNDAPEVTSPYTILPTSHNLLAPSVTPLDYSYQPTPEAILTTASDPKVLEPPTTTLPFDTPTPSISQGVVWSPEFEDRRLKLEKILNFIALYLSQMAHAQFSSRLLQHSTSSLRTLPSPGHLIPSFFATISSTFTNSVMAIVPFSDLFISQLSDTHLSPVIFVLACVLGGYQLVYRRISLSSRRPLSAPPADPIVVTNNLPSCADTGVDTSDLQVTSSQLADLAAHIRQLTAKKREARWEFNRLFSRCEQLEEDLTTGQRDIYLSRREDGSPPTRDEIAQMRFYLDLVEAELDDTRAIKENVKAKLDGLADEVEIKTKEYQQLVALGHSLDLAKKVELLEDQLAEKDEEITSLLEKQNKDQAALAKMGEELRLSKAALRRGSGLRWPQTGKYAIRRAST